MHKVPESSPERRQNWWMSHVNRATFRFLDGKLELFIEAGNSNFHNFSTCISSIPTMFTTTYLLMAYFTSYTAC